MKAGMFPSLLCLLILSTPACSPYYGKASPRVETWSGEPEKVAGRSPLTTAPAAPSQAASPSWKGLTVGLTSREEVERRFGHGTPLRGERPYRVDGISSLIAYAPNNLVQSLRISPPV